MNIHPLWLVQAAGTAAVVVLVSLALLLPFSARRQMEQLAQKRPNVQTLNTLATEPATHRALHKYNELYSLFGSRSIASRVAVVANVKKKSTEFFEQKPDVVLRANRPTTFAFSRKLYGFVIGRENIA